MKEAIIEAQKAFDIGEIPIGCVIVQNDKIIARAHNLRESLNLGTAHAEILAINKAANFLQSWRLDNTTLYVTIEPCSMCAGAIIQSRISKLVYGAYEPKGGAHRSKVNLFDINFNHKVEVIPNVLEEETSILMKNFFKNIRKKSNKL